MPECNEIGSQSSISHYFARDFTATLLRRVRKMATRPPQIRRCISFPTNGRRKRDDHQISPFPARPSRRTLLARRIPHSLTELCRGCSNAVPSLTPTSHEGNRAAKSDRDFAMFKIDVTLTPRLENIQMKYVPLKNFKSDAKRRKIDN